MATNICSKSRTKFATVKEVAEELNTSVQQIYKILRNTEMEQCVKKIGTVGIRINKERFYEILERVYR